LPPINKMVMRNEAIALAYMAGGVTLKQLGERYGISGARIRQIVAKWRRMHGEKVYASGTQA